jgi:hypothetical protein
MLKASAKHHRLHRSTPLAKFSDLDTQGFRKASNVLDAGIPVSALNVTDVGAINVSQFRKLLLRKPRSFAMTLQTLAEFD